MDEEWPAMEEQRADLTAIPTALAGALHLAVGFNPRSDGQAVAQREVVAALQAAF